MRFIFVGILFLVGCQLGVADANDKKTKMTGIYSSMVFNQESGDVLGDEVFVVFSKQGYFVVFQSSEGEPYPPVVIPAKVNGSFITFDIPSQVDPRGEFQGNVVNDELVGTFKTNGETLHLKRKKSYWQ